jgi:hypothetical protein
MIKNCFKRTLFIAALLTAAAFLVFKIIDAEQLTPLLPAQQMANFFGTKYSQKSKRPTAQNVLKPVFEASEAAAAYHKDFQNRTRILASKILVLTRKGNTFTRKAFQYELNQINEGVESLSDDLNHLKSSTNLLKERMHEKGIYAVFAGKFKVLWNPRFQMIKKINTQLQAAMIPLQKPITSRRQAISLLKKPAFLLGKLHSNAKILHVDFATMGNLLEFFVAFPPSMITAPKGRVLGQSWLAQEKQTGGWGIADPLHPGRNFSAHAIYAIEDTNPHHVVWASQATIMDFLLGRVKGQDYPYKNSSEVPYCERCHTFRPGMHAFTWCQPTNSKTMIDACKILEKTVR